MNRGKLTISNYEYIIDSYNYENDNIEYYNKFVFIRSFDYINNIAQDTDIYIIEKDIYDKYINEEYNLIFPISNTKNTGYTNNGVNFSDSFNKNFYYEFFDNNGVETSLRCNKIRIYHPNNKVILNGIVHVENYINGIHFHYFCQDYNLIYNNSKTEFIVNHNIYSEYIEFYIPDIDYLFDDNIKLYYIEDINVITSDKNVDFIKNNVLNINNVQYTPFAFFIQPYKIVENTNIETNDEVHYVKEYYKLRNCIYNMKFTFNINIFPYSYIDETNSKYIYDENLLPGSYTLSNKYSFNLISKFIFKNNIPYIYCDFNYPSKDNFINIYKNKALYYAYKMYNGIKDEYYDNKYIECELKIYTDINLKHYIYIKTLSFDLLDLKNNNIKFKLNSIFNKWVEVPDMLFCIATFKDNYLGIEYASNKVILNNEKTKYLISNDEFIINTLIESNIDMKEIKLNKDNINFINKINCIINKQDNNSNSNIIVKNSNSQRVIYKPIFYKVQDLQNIKLVKGITQNVGINLVNYMTKVDTFKLTIDGLELTEVGRNDIFVIFNINSNNLQNMTGTYNILTDSGEYISSGNYTCS